MEASDSTIALVADYTAQLAAIDRKDDQEAAALRLEYRTKMEPLLAERHALLSTVPNFWPGVLACAHTPVATFLNGTIDPKIVRAITNFQVVTRVADRNLIRTIIIEFRQNMFVEEGKVSREVDSAMNTISLSALKWKKGTERSRSDSFFAFFTAEFSMDHELMIEVVESLDTVYQNPFLAMEED